MKNSKNVMQKIIAAALIITILCASVGMTAYSAGSNNSAISADNKGDSANESTSDLSSDKNNLTKEETVYVIADSQGNAKKIIVSDWIKNTDRLDTINDVSDLENIKNLKGDETYTIDKNNMCIWDAQGNDIYYQGTSEKDIPVDLSVSYRLDGKNISPKDLAGKQGKVTMHFEYTNNQYEIKNIEGKNEKIYVPFVILTGMILDNNSFRNVQVTNGKVINDGNHTVAVGFACPGLQEDLGIESEDFEIPSSFDITADVTDFQLSTTMTLATNDIFNNVEFTKADNKLQSLTKKLDELTAATDKLIDGSSQLYKGISTLLDKSGDLISGVKTLAAGAKKLNSGAKALNTGAVTLDKGAVSLDKGSLKLKSGMQKLAKGLTELSSNSSTLNGGAKKVFVSLLSTADTQIAAAGIEAEKLTISNYSKVLNDIANSLTEENIKELAVNKAKETVTAAVKAQENLISSQVETAVKEQVLTEVLKAAGLSMTADQYTAAVAAGQISEETKTQIDATVYQQMSTDEIQETIKTNTEKQINSIIDENMKSDEVQQQIKNAVLQGKSGITAITQLKTQLDSYNEFYKGVLTYTKGVDKAKKGSDKLAQGANTLKKGTYTLKKGTKKLSEGTKTLKKGTSNLTDGVKSLLEGSGELVAGVTKLKDGSMTLSKGLMEYKKKGVQTLVDAVNGDVKGLVNRLKVISKVSSHYKSFSGLSDAMNGKVNFIYKTEGIEK